MTERPASVGLFVTCLVDLFRPTVGFAAVLAVTDAPRIASTSGAVHWDAARAAAELAAVPALAEEVARRSGQLPVLRLPYAAQGAPPADATTVVELPLRDAAARELVSRLLAAVDDAMLLALPALERLDVEVEVASPSEQRAGHRRAPSRMRGEGLAHHFGNGRMLVTE